MLDLESSATDSRRSPFRPIRTRSILAVLALSGHGLMSLVMILACSIRIDLLHRVQAHVRVGRAALIASDAFMVRGARIHTSLFVLSAVAFLLWFYRAQQNLSAFRREPLEYSPAQAAGSFFIPFVNLVRPFSVMREIWQASDPTLPPFGPHFHTMAPVSPLVAAWWSMYLAQGVLGWLALLQILGKHTVATLLSYTQFLRVELGVSSIAAGLAWVLVVLIRRRQEQLAEQLAMFEQIGVF